MLMQLLLLKAGQKRWPKKEECIILEMRRDQVAEKILLCIQISSFYLVPMLLLRCGTTKSPTLDTTSIIQAGTRIQVLVISLKSSGKAQPNLAVVIRECTLYVDTAMELVTSLVNSSKMFSPEERRHVMDNLLLTQPLIIQDHQQTMRILVQHLMKKVIKIKINLIQTPPLLLIHLM